MEIIGAEVQYRKYENEWNTYPPQYTLSENVFTGSFGGMLTESFAGCATQCAWIVTKEGNIDVTPIYGVTFKVDTILEE